MCQNHENTEIQLYEYCNKDDGTFDKGNQNGVSEYRKIPTRHKLKDYDLGTFLYK